MDSKGEERVGNYRKVLRITLTSWGERRQYFGSTSGRWNDLGGTSAGPRDGRKLGLVLTEGEGVCLRIFSTLKSENRGLYL